MALNHPTFDGATCRSCGRTERFERNRKCVFCANWAAYDQGDWKLIIELGQDARRRRTAQASSSSRRTRMREADGCVSATLIRTIFRLQAGGCAYCGARGKLHLDHAHPLALGGSNWPWNLQFLCETHNQHKGATSDAEYRLANGFPVGEPVLATVLRAASLLV